MSLGSLAPAVADDAPASRASAAANGIAVLVVLGIVGIVGAAFALHAFSILQNHDNDWYLVVAQRLLAGGRYGRDFMEPNPPLIILLSVPPVLLAPLLHLPVYTAFVAYVCGLILLSAWLAWRSLRWCMADQPVGAAVLLLCYTAILALEPGYDFGQREHLFVILFAPGLLWFAARDAGDTRPLSASNGLAVVLAAIGVLIKPFVLLVPLMMLVLKAGHHRTWRMVLDGSVVVFLLVAVLYVALVLVAFPTYLPAAAIQQEVYFAWDRAWLTVFDESRPAMMALALAVVLTELTPLEQRTRVLFRQVCVAAATCLFLALWQKKAWTYHLLPTIELAAFILAGAVIALVPRLSWRYRGRDWGCVPVAVVCAAVLLEATALAMQPLDDAVFATRAKATATPLIATLRHSFNGKSLLVLTSGYQAGIPSLAGVSLAARAPSQLLLPGAVRLAGGNAAQRKRAVEVRGLATNLLIEDLDRYHPDVVAVDRRPVKQSLPNNFDVLKFYQADPQFAQAWSDYRLAVSLNGWDLYARTAPDATKAGLLP